MSSTITVMLGTTGSFIVFVELYMPVKYDMSNGLTDM